jgi:hypothetical protein
MTGPFQYPDYQQQYGSNSPYAAQEWSTFLDRRKGLLDDINTRIQLSSQLGVPLHDADAIKNYPRDGWPEC